MIRNEPPYGWALQNRDDIAALRKEVEELREQGAHW